MMKQLHKKPAFRRIGSILLPLALTLAGCQEDEDVRLPLAVNATEIHVSQEKGSTYIQVYADGNWSATLKETVGWASLSQTEGNGDGAMLLTYDLNEGITRKAVIVLVKGDERKEIAVFQMGKNLSLRFAESNVTLPRIAAPTLLPLVSSLRGEDVKGIRVNLQYEDENAGGWITDIVIEDASFTFYVLENTTGTVRTATVSLTATGVEPGKEGETITALTNITQGTDAASCGNPLIPTELDRNAQTGLVVIPTNLSHSFFRGTYYLEPAAASDWITGVSYPFNSAKPNEVNLNFDVTENTTGALRSAVIHFSLRDGENTLVQFGHVVRQSAD